VDFRKSGFVYIEKMKRETYHVAMVHLISQSTQHKYYNRETMGLTTESVKGLSLTLEGVDNVHGSNSLTASMLGVGDGITDDVFKEYLKNTTGLLVDKTTDTLNTTTTS